MLNREKGIFFSNNWCIGFVWSFQLGLDLLLGFSVVDAIACISLQHHTSPNIDGNKKLKRIWKNDAHHYFRFSILSIAYKLKRIQSIFFFFCS